MTPTQQHRYEVWAFTLLSLAFGVSLAADFLLAQGSFASSHSATGHFRLYVAYPLLTLLLLPNTHALMLLDE